MKYLMSHYYSEYFSVYPTKKGIFCIFRIVINNEADCDNSLMLVILPLGKLRQMGCCEFGVSLGYRAGPLFLILLKREIKVEI